MTEAPKKKKSPDIRLKSKVLMIETNDKGKLRRFFTPKNNFQYLIEFSRIFNARLVEIRAERVEVLALRALVDALNDDTYPQQKVTYEELTDLTPLRFPFCQSVAGNTTVIGTTVQSELQSQTRDLLLDGGVVTTKDLIKYFGKNISAGTIRKYFRIVRASLEDDGYKLTKLGRGKYQLSNSPNA